MTSPSHGEQEGDEQRPGEDHDWLGAVSRRLVDHAATPEERLEQLLAERRRELDEQADRFAGAVADIERRDEQVRDARTSVERALRVGAADLEAREAELADHAHELTMREARIREDEAALAQRRSELGAVELKRAAVEQREQAVAVREAEVSTREEELDARETSAGEKAVDDTPAPLLLFVPGASYRLVELESAPLRSGDALEVEDVEYVVGRVGPSPLPGDDRPCAYLVLGRLRPASGGSS